MASSVVSTRAAWHRGETSLLGRDRPAAHVRNKTGGQRCVRVAERASRAVLTQGGKQHRPSRRSCTGRQRSHSRPGRWANLPPPDERSANDRAWPADVPWRHGKRDPGAGVRRAAVSVRFSLQGALLPPANGARHAAGLPGGAARSAAPRAGRRPGSRHVAQGVDGVGDARLPLASGRPGLAGGVRPGRTVAGVPAVPAREPGAPVPARWSDGTALPGTGRRVGARTAVAGGDRGRRAVSGAVHCAAQRALPLGRPHFRGGAGEAAAVAGRSAGRAGESPSVLSVGLLGSRLRRVRGPAAHSGQRDVDDHRHRVCERACGLRRTAVGEGAEPGRR